jgi:nicotinamidase-related amidase
MKRALLVIDVQNEYFTGKLPVSHPPGSLDHILTTIEAARKQGIPVVVVEHLALKPDAPTFRQGSSGADLHGEIVRRGWDLKVTKNLPGSFTGTPLESWLRAQQVDTLVICGYMTQMCCDTTARQGFHLGFNVEFLSDATGTLDFNNSAGAVLAEELHRAILVTQQARFSKIMTTQAWMDSIKPGKK